MVRVWDPTTGEEVSSFRALGQVYNVDWSPDGTHLVAAGDFTTPVVFRVWRSTEELIEGAYDCCVTRELTAEEREQLGLPER